jgi:MFS family permease
MIKMMKNSWALFIGIGIMMIAHGLQGNLMGVRSVIENFNFIATGTMMSGYYVGYFFGSNMAPKLVSRVGHIRVFAAFASMASLSILIISAYVNPVVWTLARFITGMSIVSCLVVTESWLNDRANNRTRGKLLSVYMIITFLGLAIGMLLLNFDSPENYKPFILVSILLSIALVPILLTKRKAPKFKKIGTLNLKELYKISPLGFVSSFCTGIIHSALFTLAAVYAATVNFSIFEISLLLSLITIAGAIFQWPIGFLSDRFDRRIVIVACTIVGAIFCVLSIFASGNTLQYINVVVDPGFDKLMFFIFVTVYAGASLSLFPLNVAHTNDFVPKEKFVAAGGGLNTIFGIGAMGGPIICSIFMNKFGPNSFFIFLLIFHVIIAIFALYRITRRGTEDNPDSTFTPLPKNITPLGMELDPDTGVNLSNVDKKNE